MDNATCPICSGTVAQSPRGRRIYCSASCSKKSQRLKQQLKPGKPCSIDGCEAKCRARGLCAKHWKREHGSPTRYQIVCIICQAPHTSARPDGRFCSLFCRDLWRVDQSEDPMHNLKPRSRRVSQLPVDHPVRQLIRDAHTQRSALREAFESEDWASVLTSIEAEVVKVGECWLWPRRVSRAGYGEVRLGKRSLAVHRLVMSAVLNGHLDPALPVHHRCAETLCCNPDHLQVVTHRENIAEMLERRYYVQRIAALESALRDVDPSHPVLTPWDRARGAA